MFAIGKKEEELPDEEAIVAKADRVARSVNKPQQCKMAEEYLWRVRKTSVCPATHNCVDDLIGFVRTRHNLLARECPDG